MKNKIDDLRNHLFATLEALRDEDKPMELARAQTIANVARAVIESAKVEVDFIKVTGEATATGFLPVETDDVPPKRPRRLTQ